MIIVLPIYRKGIFDMKRKLFALTMAAMASTYSYADVTKVALYGNTAPLYLADASSVNQSRIQGMNAAGENQTTIIDSNGNLKIVDKPSSNNPVATEGPTSNNMSNSNPGPSAQPDMPAAPSMGNGVNNSQGVQPPTDRPETTKPAPGMVPQQNYMPSTVPDAPNATPDNSVAAPNNMPNSTQDAAPAPATGMSH